jgi:hypothetical protein
VLLASSIDGGFGEVIEQFVGFAIQYAIALLNGGLADGLSQMTLPGAGRSKNKTSSWRAMRRR